TSLKKINRTERIIRHMADLYIKEYKYRNKSYIAYMKNKWIGILKKETYPSYLGGTERLLSSIKEISCIWDISISTSSAFDPDFVPETSPPFTSSAFPSFATASASL
ncbi:hypothetical protein O6P43_028653, partial [Quillaja saponaria]